MPLPARLVEAGLSAKGFVPRESKDRYFHYFTSDGRKTPIFTKVSHGEREIGDNLLGMMAHQCRLTRREFDDLVRCPLTREQYEARMTGRGAI